MQDVVFLEAFKMKDLRKHMLEVKYQYSVKKVTKYIKQHNE